MLRLAKRITSSVQHSLFTRPLYFNPSTSKFKFSTEGHGTYIQDDRGHDFQYSEDETNIHDEPSSEKMSEDMTIHDPKPYIDPALQDILLSDINEKILHEKLSKILGKDYLASATEIPKFPVHGVLWGAFLRPVVSMVCSYGTKSINIIFIVETGCPYTYISASALKALGINSGEAYIKINGQKTMVSQSHSRFEDCCILGSLFFLHKLTLECDYKTLEVKLKTD